jgi:hypothetical protein
LKNAAQIELSFLEFWEITPYEFSLKVNTYIEKMKHEHEEKVTLVWLGENLHRHKKLPSLDKLLGKNQQPNQPMTDKAMFNVVMELNKALGGTTIH